MEKRLVIFLVLSSLILTGYVLIRNRLFPPPHQVAKQGVDPPGAKGAKADDKADAGGQGDQPPRQPQGEPGPAEGQAEQPPVESDQTPAVQVPDEAKAEQEPAPPPVPDEWLTLGSFDPASGSRLLVTLTNRGAAIERVEMVERDARGRLRYRDLDKTYGYLGLRCQDTPAGCRVRVVGPGTPAALAQPSDGTVSAGIAVGDVIISVNDIPVGDSADLDLVLGKTKPRESITFAVRRADRATPVQLTAVLAQFPLELIDSEGTFDAPAIPSFLLSMHSVGSAQPASETEELPEFAVLRTSTWEAERPAANEIVFRRRVKLSGPEAVELEVVKRFRLGVPGADADPTTDFSAYHLHMTIEVKNLSQQLQTVSYLLDGPNGLPLEGWWYTNKIHPNAFMSSAGARDVIWRVDDRGHSLRGASQIYKQASEAPSDSIVTVLTDSPSPEERTLDYLGVDTQYFSAVLMGGSMAEPEPYVCQQAFAMPVGDFSLLTGRDTKKLNTSFRMVSIPKSIEAGQNTVDEFHIFLGPKAPPVLAAYQLSDIIEYGWFGKIARPLSWLLQRFYSIVHNYGLAIVLLTVLVRGAMFPIGRKAARNAQIMQELAPEIKKIKEKYKNDLEKQGQAQRELWKRHNFNPLSGCWLMFLQLPIFIGLYRCLSVDINLRQAPLIPGIEWCSNLAGPDMAWKWQGLLPDLLASETGWLGPYLNILPIITIILFIVQQKMFTPPATDEQTQMQQKMMKYMMIFMGVLFFKVPSGLCVYFIASSLWGIGERKLLPKPGTEPPTKGPITEKKSLMQRLKEKAEGKTAVDPAELARERRKRRRP